MSNKIIWQPFVLYQPYFDFGILLSRDFCREMLETKLSREIQIKTNNLCLEVSERFGFNYPEPVTFYEDTAFISQFYLGNNGVWLAIDQSNKRSLLEYPDEKELIKYSSHNVDNSKQAYALMALVDWWAEYADIIKSHSVRAV